MFYLGQDLLSVKDVKGQFENGNIMCPCQPSCTEENYPVTATSKTWPSSKYQVTKVGQTSKIVDIVSSVNCCCHVWNRRQSGQQFDQSQCVLYIVERENNRRCS